VPAILYLSKKYTEKHNNNLVIYIHGNNQKYTKKTSDKSFKWLMDNDYSFASIQIQDKALPPYDNNNSGWGNDEAYNRILNLYQFLIKEYKFNDEVIIIGASMGGLTMGQILLRDDIKVKLAIGMGPVPSLKTIWENAPERRIPIRNSYSLKLDGSEDFKMDSIFKKNDWKYLIENSNKRIKPTYLYYGKDDVFEKDFGGLQEYINLENILKTKSEKTNLKTNNSKTHADPTLLEIPINDKILKALN